MATLEQRFMTAAVEAFIIDTMDLKYLADETDLNEDVIEQIQKLKGALATREYLLGLSQFLRSHENLPIPADVRNSNVCRLLYIFEHAK